MSIQEGNGKPRARGKLGNKVIENAVRDAVFKAGSARVADFVAQLQVSEVSIRKSLVGPSVLDAIGSIGFSKAFIGISGFTIAGGFMLNDIPRAEVTRAILERVKRCRAKSWVLTDSSKFGVSHAATICADLSLIAGVVTDSGIPDMCRRHLEAAGLKILS